MSYNNPIPVVVACLRVFVNEDDVKLLAIQRATEPFIGGLAFPGGYVNQGETAEQAIVREIAEETGIDTKSAHWRPVMTSITPQNQLLIFMRHVRIMPANTVFAPTREASSFVLVDQDDELCFPLHTEILKRRFFWE